MMSIENLRQLLQENIETLLDSKHGYLRAGHPKFMRLFGRDSLISAWQMLPLNPEIAKNTLQILSKLQGKKNNAKNEEEPGKILHETDLETNRHPTNSDIIFPYFGSVDATPLFLILFQKYIAKTGDKKFLKKFKFHVETAVTWVREKLDNDKTGFIRYQRKKERGQLFHQGWKDAFWDHLKITPPVAIIEVQGYGYAALKSAARLLQDEKLDKKAAEIQKNFTEYFWIKDENYFALGLDFENKKRRAIASNPGHLLFTNIVSNKTKTNFLINRLFSAELWTPYGIRTHSKNEPDFNAESYHFGSIWPHDNWIIAQGCRNLGYEDKYQKIKNAIVGACQKLEGAPEYYTVTENGTLNKPPQACSLQAWSSGAVLNFLVS